jgi:hypothetical protein
MGHSEENVLCRTARHRVPGIEGLWHGATLCPMKSFYTPIPRHQCEATENRDFFDVFHLTVQQHAEHDQETARSPHTQMFLRPPKTKTKQRQFPNRTMVRCNSRGTKLCFLKHPNQPLHPTHPGPQNKCMRFVSIAQMPTFVSVTHDRRGGLTECSATQRVIAPSVWPCHRS